MNLLHYTFSNTFPLRFSIFAKTKKDKCMKKKLNYLLLLMCVMSSIITSCKKEEPSKLSVSTASINLTAAGGSQALSVSSNTNWAISGGGSWLSVSPSSGSGDTSINLSATENKGFESRNCTLTFSTVDGKASASVTVSQEAAKLNLEVNVYELNFSEKEGDIQQLTITSNSDWRITGNPKWLDLSSTSGSGKSTINLTTNSFNNSSSARQETLIVTANGASVEVKVTQKAGLMADCVVKLDDVVTLSDEVAFNFTYANSVSYYHVGILDKSDAGRMTDDEIIEILSSNFDRYTPSDSWVISFYDLESVHDYTIYTIAYNKDGKRGELVSKEIRTKSGKNQPYAAIGNVRIENGLLKWETKMGAYCSKYYQWVLTGNNYTTHWQDSDGIVAWFFNYEMRKNPNSYKPIIQDGVFNKTYNYEGYLQFITWGEDLYGDLSGIITNELYTVSSSSKLESTNVSSRSNGASPKILAVKLKDLIDNTNIYIIE